MAPPFLLPGHGGFNEAFPLPHPPRHREPSPTGYVRRLATGEILAIFCADFSLGSWLQATTLGGIWGQGRVDRDELKRLRRDTKAIRELGNAVVIWMVHFPPAFPNAESSLSLIGHEELVEAAVRSGVSAIICGHTHETLHYTVGPQKQLPILCVGTGTQYVAPHGNDVQVIHLNRNGTTLEIARDLYRWSDEQQNFVVAD